MLEPSFSLYMEEQTLKGRKQQKVLALSPTMFSDDGPWAKGATILFLSSIVPIRTSGLVRFVLLSTQFSVFVRDHARRKVTCLPSHPLEKLVVRKKRRGSEAVVEALPPVVVVLGSCYFDSKGNRWFPTFSGFRNHNHLSLQLLHPKTFF
ncbi:hypothetical protein V6N13_135423 [Hibiscus sabdariffa]|uniref:Uncharacterized protein n=1 Tax=Hibiscus sabdariffa TaxID=183260 RepID=A0ABR2R6S7_9ROSI